MKRLRLVNHSGRVRSAESLKAKADQIFMQNYLFQKPKSQGETTTDSLTKKPGFTLFANILCRVVTSHPQEILK